MVDELSGLSGGAAAVAASAEAAGVAGARSTHNTHAAHGHGHGGACLNCQTPLAPEARFCSQCGQDTANHPPSLVEFVHEFVSHYIAVEGTLWKSLWGLMARPGFLTLEYLAGRKQRYVLPLRLLLTLGLVFFLVLKLAPSSLAKVNRDVAAVMQDADDDTPAPAAARAPRIGAAASAASSAAEPASAAKAADEPIHIKIGDSDQGTLVGVDADTLAHLPPGIQARLTKANEHWRADPKGSVRAMGATMLGLAPYAVLCSLPFFAGLLKLLFWRQPYGAHFVFAMHLHAAWYGMLLLAVLLPWSGVGFALWLWSNIYPIVALKRVHAASWWTTLLRGGLLAMMHWVIIALGLTVLVLAGVLAAS